MKRLLVLLAILLAGCVTTQLDQRVAKLELQMAELEDIGVMEEAAEVGAAARMYGRTNLTGVTKSVQNISEGALVEGDMCTVIDSNNYRYFYRWKADNNNTTNPHSVPTVIVPTVSDGTGAWILSERTYSQGFYSAAPDGEHFMDSSNSSSLPASPPDGAMSVRDDYGIYYISDGVDWWPGRTSWYEEYTTNSNLPYDAHWGGLATNYGASGGITLNLKKAVLGMEVNFHVVTDVHALYVNPDDADKFVGVANADDGEYYWANSIGEYITLKAVQNGPLATDVDWAVHNIKGIWQIEP